MLQIPLDAGQNFKVLHRRMKKLTQQSDDSFLVPGFELNFTFQEPLQVKSEHSWHESKRGTGPCPLHLTSVQCAAPDRPGEVLP